MPKISELTVADLRGARDQIEAHLRNVYGINDSVTIAHKAHGITLFMFHGATRADGVSIHEMATYDADWSEFMAVVWKRIGQIPSREARELRSVMQKLGDAVELLADSPSEFAVTLTARLKALRDEAGARLIEHQPAE